MLTRKFMVEANSDGELFVRLAGESGIMVCLTADDKSITVTTPRHQEPATDRHGHGFKACY